MKQVPRLFSPEDVGQREAAQLAGSQAGGLEPGLQLRSSAALLPGVMPGLLLIHTPAQALKPHAALGKRTFLQTWAADPGPIPATRLGPQGVGCFRRKKAVKQLCLHVLYKSHTAVLVIAVPFRMDMSHKSWLVPVSRNYQGAVTLRSSCFW